LEGWNPPTEHLEGSSDTRMIAVALRISGFAATPSSKLQGRLFKRLIIRCLCKKPASM
jgi:hypothetical protein